MTPAGSGAPAGEASEARGRGEGGTQPTRGPGVEDAVALGFWPISTGQMLTSGMLLFNFHSFFWGVSGG